MKPFLQFINEANYERFLKKNKNLSKEEIKIINTYFSKTNRKAGKAFSKKHKFWADPKLLDWSYEDYRNVMVATPSGRRATFKPPTIPGTEGEDYWVVKVKTKGFFAAIPLTQETATYMNSGRYGCEGAEYCIGWEDDAQNWDYIVIEDQQVPVYVTNGAEKWVVMIHEGNRSYQVWDKMNNDRKSQNDEIDGFDTKKNLLTSSLKKLYDEIREEFFNEDKKATKPPVEAQDDYDNLVDVIENAAQEIEDNRDNFEHEMKRIKEKTLKRYEERVDKLQVIRDLIEEDQEKIQTSKPDENGNYHYYGEVLDKAGYEALKEKRAEAFDKAYDEWNDMDDKWNEIDDMDSNDMVEHYDEYEWEGEVPDEDGRYQMIEDITNYPDPGWYSDLADYYDERHGMDIESDSIKEAIWSYVFEGSWNDSAESMLSREGVHRPA